MILQMCPPKPLEVLRRPSLGDHSLANSLNAEAIWIPSKELSVLGSKPKSDAPAPTSSFSHAK